MEYDLIEESSFLMVSHAQAYDIMYVSIKYFIGHSLIARFKQVNLA